MDAKELLKNTVLLRAVLATLSPREQKILNMRFGIEDGITHTLEQVGKEFGVTRERVRQIEAKALARIQGMLNLKVASVHETDIKNN